MRLRRQRVVIRRFHDQDALNVCQKQAKAAGLSESALKGGADPFRGVVCPLVSDLRSATLADFEAFRVCSKGYVL